MIGVLLIYFDVATAMILFSIIQLAANGWRAFQWWSYVRWDIIWLYCVGGAVAFAVLRLIAFIPDKALVYLLLGLMPFAVEILPASWRPNIEWRGVPFFTGIFTTIIQFMSGVGGPFLDIFFQKSMLDRKTTLATKAIAQSASHVLRLVYFVSLTGVAGVETCSRGRRDGAGDRRHHARALRHRAHDRRRLPAMDALRHLHDLHHLSDPGGVAVLAGLRRRP